MSASTFVLALTGPGGAGKSTVARLLARKVRESVNVEVDAVKMFLASAYRYDRPEGIEQWRLLGHNLGSLAAGYETAGYNVIVNGYLTLEAWAALEERVKLTHRVLLLLTLDEVIARDAARSWDDGLGEPEIRRHHTLFYTDPFFAGFTTIDSTHQTAEETAAAVAALLPPESLFLTHLTPL